MKNQDVAEISAQLRAMFGTAGGLLLIAVVITIVVEMGFEQSVPVVVYAIMCVLMLGIFGFYGLNIYALIRISTAIRRKEVSYRNSELEAMHHITFHQAVQQLSVINRQQPGPAEIKPTFVKQKTLRQRKPAPQIAPAGSYPVMETLLNQEDKSPIPNNVVPLNPDSSEPDDEFQ